MKLKIDRAVLEELDDEVIVQDIALELGENFHTPEGAADSFASNPHLTRPQVNIVLIGLSLIEVLNGGVFQLIMNPTGSLIPDLPVAFRTVGRAEEAAIFDAVLGLFPDRATLRDPEARETFVATKLIPGGWDGLVAAKDTAVYRQLSDWDDRLGDLMQSEAFFAAIASYLEAESESFEIVDVD